MLGGKKIIKEIQSKCALLELENQHLSDKYQEVLEEIIKMRKELNDRLSIDNKESAKEAYLDKLKDHDGMYNYQLYKQRKMGLGGYSDEDTK